MASASTSAPHHHGNTTNSPKSHFQQTVCLADWWLVKAENDVQGRRLAVAGLTAWGKQAMRVFTSGPILKRYDVCTIETSDGICVVLDGLMNKARTLENGFPSVVLNYFVFGFPPYWKECDEKFVAKVPPSRDISSAKLPEKLSQQQVVSMKGAHHHVDSHDKYSGSQGKSKAKGRQKSKKGKSFTVPLPNTTVSGLLEEAYSGGTTSVEDHTAPELHVNDFKNETKSLSDLSCGDIKVQAVIDKHVDYSQIRDRGGTQSACHLNKKRTEEATNKLSKVGRNKKTRTDCDRDVSSSERIFSHDEVRVTIRSLRSFKMKQMNYNKSAEISDGEKIRLSSTSSVGSGKVELEPVFDQEAGYRKNWNSEGKGIREKPRSKILNVKNKATEVPRTSATSTKSRHSPASVDNRQDTVSTGKSSLSKKGNASDMETRQKLESVSKETPKSKKKKVQSVSPQSFSFNRSRSGRLLMPTLEFWRNQRAVYNADRTITGINEDMHPQQLRNEGGSTSHGERRN